MSPLYANIINGEFEQWDNQTPVGWTDIDSGITVTENSEISLSGNSSASVAVTTKVQSSTDFRQTIDVIAGETYLFEVAVYHTEGGVSARLYVDGYRGYSFPQLVGEWQTLSYEYTADSSGSIDVGLRFYDRAGFDGLEVVYIDGFSPNLDSAPTRGDPEHDTAEPTACKHTTITIDLITDRYGSETSWTLTDSNDNIVAQANDFENNTEYADSYCLEDGEYTFTINDTYGDGICCSYGLGSYAITNDGETLIAGGEFGALESKTFSISNSDQPGPEPTLDPYYSDAENLSGYALKSALFEIIRDHNSRGYSALWGFYGDVELDLYYEKDGSILDIYSENPNGREDHIFTAINDQCGNFRQEGDCYNREHSFPRNWFGGDREPMNSDAHHIFLSDGFVNSKRGSLPYGEVSNATFTSNNGSKVGLAKAGSGYSGFVFEPLDEFKGDIARAQLYMATRYENLVSSWPSNSSTANAVLNGSQSQVFEDWYLSLLIQWHRQDPVSQKEIDRNNATFNYQGNRNPFVDVPAFVERIWQE